MVPTGTGKTGKMRRHLPLPWKSQGILLRLKKSGNFTQNTGKIRRNYTAKLKKKTYWKNSGNLSGTNNENPTLNKKNI